jgi:hypothetical protein
MLFCLKCIVFVRFYVALASFRVSPLKLKPLHVIVLKQAEHIT